MNLCLDPEIIGPWVCESPKRKWIPGKSMAIGKIKDGRPVAGVLYEEFTGTNLVMHIRGEQGWADRRFLWFMFYYPFVQLGCKRITAPIVETNKQCIRLVEHMGLTLECRLEQATPDGDVLLYRMWKHECRFLGKNYAKHACST